MSFDYIKVEKRGKITIITINRPEAYNALNYPSHQELNAAIVDYRDDPDQWVAIITGAGEKAFCAGHDLKQQAAGGGLETTDNGFGGLA